MCVPHGVGHRLERDSVGRRLHRGGQLGQLLGPHDRDAQVVTTPRGEGVVPHRLRAQRVQQTELVERRRAQPLDEPSDVVQSRLHLVARRGQQRCRRVRSSVQEVAGGLDPKRDAGQRRSEAVVEVTPQPAPFILAGGDQLLARPLQVEGEPLGVHCHAGLGGQRLEQLTVAGGKLPAGLPPADGERPDLGAPGSPGRGGAVAG